MKQIRKALVCTVLGLCMALCACPAEALAAADPSLKNTTAATQKTTEAHKHSFGIWEVQRTATTKKNGLLVRTCSGCGKKQTKIVPLVTVAKVQSVNKSYTGKPVTNKITVQDANGKTLKQGQDYTVDYSNNVNVGVAKMNLQGIGKYGFRFSKSFRILPKQTQINQIQPSAKKAVLKWTPVKKQASGYVVQYGTDSSFQNKGRTYTVKGKSPTASSLTIKDLKPKTVYFVHIRTYKVVKDQTFYSNWCKTLKFKTPSASPHRIDGQLPKSARVDASYFNDVVFVGDSISTGLSYYEAANDVLGKAQFLTSVSLSATNALWEVSKKSVHPRYNGQKMKVEDAIPLTGAKKVYIMLGMNDIISVGVDKSVANFTKLCNKILEKAPYVKIYVESVTPRTNQGKKSNSGVLNNKNITLYNRKLAALCQKRGWYFVNVAEVMFDKSGYLNRSYCSDPNGMGMHFAYSGCKVWVDYLYTHTA